jgi:hypothetical protein
VSAVSLKPILHRGVATDGGADQRLQFNRLAVKDVHFMPPKCGQPVSVGMTSAVLGFDEVLVICAMHTAYE